MILFHIIKSMALIIMQVIILNKTNLVMNLGGLILVYFFENTFVYLHYYCRLDQINCTIF